MNTVEKTDHFDRWLKDLKDLRGKAKILTRVKRLEMGNPGKVNDVGGGISEMKIDHGPGYRVYFQKTGNTIFLLLCGGDKASQAKDIKRAKELAAS